MKRTLSIILSAVMLLCLLPSMALSASAVAEGNNYYDVSNGEVTITSVAKTMTLT